MTGFRGNTKLWCGECLCPEFFFLRKKICHLSVTPKLDRVGPVDNRPSPDKLNHKKDTGNMTCDTGHVTNGEGLTFSQNCSSPAQTVWQWQCLEDSERKDHLPNELMSNGGDCRTAPATPGLLKRELNTHLMLAQIDMKVFTPGLGIISWNPKWNT